MILDDDSYICAAPWLGGRMMLVIEPNEEIFEVNNDSLEEDEEEEDRYYF